MGDAGDRLALNGTGGHTLDDVLVADNEYENNGDDTAGGAGHILSGGVKLGVLQSGNSHSKR